MESAPEQPDPSPGERGGHDGPAPRPRVKRRWAIVSKAGGGAAVLAVAGALAIGAPDDQAQPGDAPASEQTTLDDSLDE